MKDLDFNTADEGVAVQLKAIEVIRCLGGAKHGGALFFVFKPLLGATRWGLVFCLVV